MPEPLREIIFTAAHGGVSTAVPVGGGAAVAHALAEQWAQRAPFKLTMLGLGQQLGIPGVAYQQIPVRYPPGCGAAELVRLNELAYARVSRDFERETTRRILSRDDLRGVCVLANDLSEGPDFAALGAAGVSVVTLWHVDVIDYFCRFYLGGLPPARATAAWRWWTAHGGPVPDVLKLVFDKQTAAVRQSRYHVVPSSPMRDVIEQCFPGAARKVVVVPWGTFGATPGRPDGEVEQQVKDFRSRFGLREGDQVLLTLSRISPEKGLERLLQAVALGEQRGEVKPGLRVWIAGEAAFMMGQRYLRRLQDLAARLRVARVDFVGYAAGAQKQALWRLADLYVFPSRHESYGLTLAEALAAGVPVVTTAHYSARDLVPPGAGVIVPNRPEAAVAPALWRALRELLRNPAKRAAMAAAGGRQGAFDDAADRVADICRAAVS